MLPLIAIYYVSILLEVLVTLANPHTVSRPPPVLPIVREELAPRLHPSCTRYQRHVLSRSWWDASHLAYTHAMWRPTTAWVRGSPQDVMNSCLGDDSCLDAPAGGGEGPLRQNVLRQRGLFFADSDWSPVSGSIKLAMICDEEAAASLYVNQTHPNLCADPRRGSTTYTKGFGSQDYVLMIMVFCPRFFGDHLDSLYSIDNSVRRLGPPYTRSVAPWAAARARYILRNTYQWPHVSDPQCDRFPPLATPLEILQLAATENTYGRLQGQQGAARNAHSWVLAAIMMHILTLFPGTSIPIPGIANPSPRRDVGNSLPASVWQEDSSADGMVQFEELPLRANLKEIGMDLDDMPPISDVGNGNKSNNGSHFYHAFRLK